MHTFLQMALAWNWNANSIIQDLNSGVPNSISYNDIHYTKCAYESTSQVNWLLIWRFKKIGFFLNFIGTSAVEINEINFYIF